MLETGLTGLRGVVETGLAIGLGAAVGLAIGLGAAVGLTGLRGAVETGLVALLEVVEEERGIPFIRGLGVFGPWFPKIFLFMLLP